MINEKEGWNGINVLNTDASKVGTLDLGITTKPTNDKAKVVVLLGADNFRHEDIPSSSILVPQVMKVFTMQI